MSEKQHQSLKALAALEGKPIRQYAIERLFPADADAGRAWAELQTLISARVKAGLAGEVSDKSVGEPSGLTAYVLTSAAEAEFPRDRTLLACAMGR